MKLPKSISKAFQNLKDKVSAVVSKKPSIAELTSIENFVTADWKDNIAVLLCVKCEQPFEIDPCKDENLVWCDKKKVSVPQCPHCGTNDIEK